MHGSNNLIELNFNHIVADLLAIRIQLLNLVDFEQQFDLLQQLEKKLTDPVIWDQHELIKQLSKEKSKLENRLLPIKTFAENVINIIELFNMAKDLEDLASIEECQRDLLILRDTAKNLEFECMFCGDLDPNNAFLDLQAGSGGTEAQDWAEILLRMYLRWAESRKFQVEIMEISAGEVAGIKSATIKISGNYAYGWLRYETGVHRLVRKSPFDSGNRRHTSFAAVFVYPEVDDEIQVDINPSDLKVDTYRASGAGGQHVNRTDSAVRITHIPSGIVVQCQSDRSQHKNKAYAFKQLKAKLYDLEMQAKNQEKRKLEDAKTDIGWGNQIRSYVLDQSRIKDLRSNLEIFDPQQVLDGGIDPFLESNLKKLNFKSKDK